MFTHLNIKWSTSNLCYMFLYNQHRHMTSNLDMGNEPSVNIKIISVYYNIWIFQNTHNKKITRICNHSVSQTPPIIARPSICKRFCRFLKHQQNLKRVSGFIYLHQTLLSTRCQAVFTRPTLALSVRSSYRTSSGLWSGEGFWWIKHTLLHVKDKNL